MTEAPRSRRLVALAAAYVVALQALLLPLSVAAGVQPGSSLCATAASAASPQSGGSHSTGCPCAAGCGMQCCAQELAGPPHIVVAVAALIRAGQVLSPPATEPVPRRSLHRPQLARGPPAA